MKKQNTPDVKERILQVARELFVKHGYDGTSVRDIATASGTNVAHITYYFQSKYNLFEIIFEEAFTVVVSRVFPIWNSDLPLREMVKAWVDTYYELLPRYPYLPLFILNEINHNYQGRLIKIIKGYNPREIFEKISAKIEHEISQGSIREISPADFILDLVSLSVFPFAFGLLVTRVADIPQEEYNEILQRHKSHVTNLLLGSLEP
ncbi:MAG: TetR/AcrR family transcriptional regulator [Odoribacteraceae bacterium]|jgi:AcrR family transcriptional regulator|nr:TetR/AcrR family transcriptional regulator [Odoribacteraceae bacterium]